MDINEKIRHQILAHMKEKGLDQTAVARLLGISPQAVGQILRGNRGKVPTSLINVLEKIGMTLDATPEDAQNSGSA